MSKVRAAVTERPAHCAARISDARSRTGRGDHEGIIRGFAAPTSIHSGESKAVRRHPRTSVTHLSTDLRA